jgi:hypothetical protein
MSGYGARVGGEGRGRAMGMARGRGMGRGRGRAPPARQQHEWAAYTQAPPPPPQQQQQFGQAEVCAEPLRERVRIDIGALAAGGIGGSARSRRRRATPLWQLACRSELRHRLCEQECERVLAGFASSSPVTFAFACQIGRFSWLSLDMFRYYFHVNNIYVINKLKVVLFPCLHRVGALQLLFCPFSCRHPEMVARPESA